MACSELRAGRLRRPSNMDSGRGGARRQDSHRSSDRTCRVACPGRRGLQQLVTPNDACKLFRLSNPCVGCDCGGGGQTSLKGRCRCGRQPLLLVGPVDIRAGGVARRLDCLSMANKSRSPPRSMPTPACVEAPRSTRRSASRFDTSHRCAPLLVLPPRLIVACNRFNLACHPDSDSKRL